MISSWMRFVIALMILPFCFMTEYFIVAQWLHLVHVSWWWIVYAIAADTGNGYLVRRLVFGKDEKVA